VSKDGVGSKEKQVLCCLSSDVIFLSVVLSGKDYRNQLEMVFNVVGTPTAAYVNTAHSELIKDFLISEWMI